MSGYGDGSSPVQEAEPLQVLPGALDEALPVLTEHPETSHRIERVLALTEGFESAYGLELLASIHWVITEEGTPAGDLDAIVDRVQAWNARKGRLFSRDHITIAWKALRERGWTPAFISA